MKLNLPSPGAEVVGDFFRSENGKIVFRFRPGRVFNLTALVRTIKQPDGSFLVQPVGPKIRMALAVEISGIPYSTLLRLIMAGRVKAAKPTVGRWEVDLESLLAHKDRASDPYYWDN